MLKISDPYASLGLPPRGFAHFMLQLNTDGIALTASPKGLTILKSSTSAHSHG